MESPKSDAVELGGMKNYTVRNKVNKVKIQGPQFVNTRVMHSDKYILQNLGEPYLVPKKII